MKGLPGPDFVVAGAMRSGSSSMNRYLADHPQVAMALPKEPGYFDQNYEKGPSWYARFWRHAAPGQLCGDTSPSTLQDAEGVRRLGEVPEVKVVVLLRDPVDRLYSHYWMRRGLGNLTVPFPAVVKWGLEDDRHIFWHSRYAAHLETLFEAVDPRRCLVLGFEGLQQRPEDTFLTVCRFLGLEEELPSSVGETVNAGRRVRSRRVRDWSRARLPKLLQNAVGKLNHATLHYPPMDPAVRKQLDEAYAPDRNAAKQAIDRTLSLLPSVC